MANSKIFILSAIDIRKRDDKRWQKLFEICKVQHPVWGKKTLNEYKEFEIGWGRLYDIYDFNAAYFIDKDKAIEYAEANMADINESGAYPYIVIIPRCINLMYPESCKEDITVLKYDHTIDKYNIVEADDDEYVMPIIQHYTLQPVSIISKKRIKEVN